MTFMMETNKSRPLSPACWVDGTSCFHGGAKKWSWCARCGKSDVYVSKSTRWCYECFEQQVSPLCGCHRVARSDGFEGPPPPPSTPAPRNQVRPPPPPAPSMPGQSSADMWEVLPPLLALMPPQPGSTTLAASTHQHRVPRHRLSGGWRYPWTHDEPVTCVHQRWRRREAWPPCQQHPWCHQLGRQRLPGHQLYGRQRLPGQQRFPLCQRLLHKRIPRRQRMPRQWIPRRQRLPRQRGPRESEAWSPGPTCNRWHGCNPGWQS